MGAKKWHTLEELKQRHMQEEHDLFDRTLELCGGNRNQAAFRLGITPAQAKHYTEVKFPDLAGKYKTPKLRAKAQRRVKRIAALRSPKPTNQGDEP